METSYDVRIWKTQVYVGSRKTTHTARWAVAGQARKKSFRTAALADAYRSQLVTSARRGEAFDVDTGEPVSIVRAQREVTVSMFAREYAAMKWGDPAPNSRRNTARALTDITVALVTSDRGRPDEDELRKALMTWAFNLRPSRPDSPPGEVTRVLTWLDRNTRAVEDLAKPAVTREVLSAIGRNGDGSVSAPATVQRQRGVLVNLAEYAVERRLLTQNPITNLSWKAPRMVSSVDRRVVVNPGQARTLLDAVGSVKPSGDGLVAFFGAMYYAVGRPGSCRARRN